MRVVLDTNFWVSALVYSRESSVLHQILNRFLKGDFELVTSPALLEEFSELCKRHRVAPSVVQKYLMLMQRTRTEIPPYVRYVVPTNRIDYITADPDDNRVLECAVAGKANLIVTGDKHLLNLSKFGNTTILSPRDFIEQLEKRTAPH